MDFYFSCINILNKKLLHKNKQHDQINKLLHVFNKNLFFETFLKTK